LPRRSRPSSAPSCSTHRPRSRRPRNSKLKPEQAADPAALRKVALDYLARREHSELELTRKLVTRGFDAGLVEATLHDLVAERLLSDARFAEAFVHSRFQRGSGPQKIHAELRERGVDDTLISDSIETYAAQWQALIREVREKKFGTAMPADFRERSRQMRFLQQRGFSAEQIAGVFRDPE
jgi:regulatory protein